MIEEMRIEPVKIPKELDIQAKMGGIHKSSKPKSATFSEVLRNSVRKVNELQLDADNLTNRLALGEVDDISEVSIAVEKAELALRLMVQIRDKMVDAYQQIARMSV
ncbi:MAG: flagellar hook-basal body complex protein FliE [Synergistaceae bacterium]|nr:flagellar hook-basal body complex protein FliE [Synergistaceae bacterium]